MRNNFTIRVEGQKAVISRDDGSTALLGPNEIAAIAHLAQGITAERFSYGLESAAAKAGTAEATCTIPRPLPHGGELIDAARSAWPPRSSVGGERGVSLGRLASRASRPLTTVLDSRFSERRYAPLDVMDLAGIIVPASRLRSWASDDAGLEVGSAATPSAGGRHPLALAVLSSEVEGLAAGSWMFLPASCRLVPAGYSEKVVTDALDRVGQAARTVKRPPAAVVVLGRMARTLVRYPAGSTLFWRDVGAQLGYLHLCAADMGLASTITGTAGLLGGVLNGCIDVGALAVGRRPA